MLLPTAGLVFFALFHISSPSQRFAISLDGIWKFKISPDNQADIGFSEEWWNKDFSLDLDAIDMPVPSSYNDVTTDSAIRDFVGWAWYQRHLDLPDLMIHWKGIVVFHFGSAQYYTRVWVNNVQIGSHEGGHIPFEFVMPEGFGHLNLDKLRVTVAVNNTLNNHTIPQGSLTFQRDEDDFEYKTYTHAFDYFDYAGLNGGVRLIFKPPAYIDNVIIHNTTISSFNLDHDKTTYGANIWWSSQLFQPFLLKDPWVHYVVKDPFGKVVVTNEHPLESLRVTILTTIDDPQFWWPRSTFEEHFQPGMMYELQVTLKDGNVEVDKLSQTFGIRIIEINGKHLLMNGKLLYLKGFGMHQDAEIRGRGFDQVQLVRDINLLKWTGANAIRTSHYPYPEEFLEMADRHGIMVILETPACSLSGFDETLLKRHKEVLSEMWEAFKNHPSVIMWSLANEPESNEGNSTQYFKELVDHIKSLDPSRLITFVTSQLIKNEKAIQSVDVISLNRYQGWYSLGGRLDLIQHHVTQEIQGWSDSYGKPVIMTEYGAEAISGYHSLPSTMWTENYQIELFHEHFKAFDFLLQKRSLSGEMVWNFADFKVPQEYFRAEYCDKGIFTRNRQPKSAAYTIKTRYEALLLGESVTPSAVLC